MTVTRPQVGRSAEPPAPKGPTPAAPAPEVAGARMEAWWDDLQKGEFEATRAILEFSARPNEAVAFLARRMKPLKIDADRVKDLIEMLKSDQEEAWMPAFEYLEYFDPRLAIDLPVLMLEVTDLRARQRIVEVMSGRKAGSLEGKEVSLKKLSRADGFNFSSDRGSWWAEHRVDRINSDSWSNRKKKWTRAVRAIALLEHIGTSDAIAILKAMANGHPEAQPTKAAKQALEQVASKVR
jgi:hypothetical protein